MLSGPDLVIEHLLLNLAISTTATIAVSFGNWDKHQEVNDKAGDYQLDQGANHEHLGDLNIPLNLGKNVVDCCGSQPNRTAVALPLEVAVHKEVHFEIKRIGSILHIFQHLLAVASSVLIAIPVECLVHFVFHRYIFIFLPVVSEIRHRHILCKLGDAILVKELSLSGVWCLRH